MLSRWSVALLVASAFALAASAQSKDSVGLMPLDVGICPVEISTPAIAPEEIIRRFAAKEREFQTALNFYAHSLNRTDIFANGRRRGPAYA